MGVEVTETVLKTVTSVGEEALMEKCCLVIWQPGTAQEATTPIP